MAQEAATKTFPIVDGDTNADVYGQASSADEALDIARGCFADEVSHVELYGPIALSSGETLSQAYVAFTAVPHPSNHS